MVFAPDRILYVESRLRIGFFHPKSRFSKFSFWALWCGGFVTNWTWNPCHLNKGRFFKNMISLHFSRAQIRSEFDERDVASGFGPLQLSQYPPRLFSRIPWPFLSLGHELSHFSWLLRSIKGTVCSHEWGEYDRLIASFSVTATHSIHHRLKVRQCPKLLFTHPHF